MGTGAETGNQICKEKEYKLEVSIGSSLWRTWILSEEEGAGKTVEVRGDRGH